MGSLRKSMGSLRKSKLGGSSKSMDQLRRFMNFLKGANGINLGRDLVRFPKDINEHLKEIKGFLKDNQLQKDLVNIA